jgi:hypothetical protein
LRKRFWTDALKSLYIDFDTIYMAAREENAKGKAFVEKWFDGENLPVHYVTDLEDRILRVQQAVEQWILTRKREDEPCLLKMT